MVFLFPIVLYHIFIIHLRIVLMASDFYVTSSGALLFSLAKLYLMTDSYQIHLYGICIFFLVKFFIQRSAKTVYENSKNGY